MGVFNSSQVWPENQLDQGSRMSPIGKGNAGSAAGIKLVTRECQQARKTGRFARNYDPTTDSADLFSRFPLCPSEVSPQNRHRTGILIPDQVEQRERHLSKYWGVEQ